MDGRLLVDLSDALAEVYPTREDAWRLVDRAGLDPTQIDFGGAAAHFWHAVVRYAVGREQVVDLVEVTLPGNERLRNAAVACLGLEVVLRLEAEIVRREAFSERAPTTRSLRKRLTKLLEHEGKTAQERLNLLDKCWRDESRRLKMREHWGELEWEALPPTQGAPPSETGSGGTAPSSGDTPSGAKGSVVNDSPHIAHLRGSLSNRRAVVAVVVCMALAALPVINVLCRHKPWTARVRVAGLSAGSTVTVAIGACSGTGKATNLNVHASSFGGEVVVDVDVPPECDTPRARTAGCDAPRDAGDVDLTISVDGHAPVPIRAPRAALSSPQGWLSPWKPVPPDGGCGTGTPSVEACFKCCKAIVQPPLSCHRDEDGGIAIWHGAPVHEHAAQKRREVGEKKECDGVNVYLDERTQ